MINEQGKTLLLAEDRLAGGLFVALDEAALLALFNTYQGMHALGNHIKEIAMRIPDGCCADVLMLDYDDPQGLDEGVLEYEGIDALDFGSLLPAGGQGAMEVTVDRDGVRFCVDTGLPASRIEVSRSFNDIWALLQDHFEWAHLVAPAQRGRAGQAFTDFVLAKCAESGICPDQSDPSLLIEPTGEVNLRQIDRSANEVHASVVVRYDLAIALSELEPTLAVKPGQPYDDSPSP